MAWHYNGRAKVSPRSPRAFAVCDRCGFRYNRDALNWQFDYEGPRLFNKRILVCRPCTDKPFVHNRPIIVPPDPMPIRNPRPDIYAVENFNSAALTDSNGELLRDTTGRPILNTSPDALNIPPYPFPGFVVLRAEGGSVSQHAVLDDGMAVQTSTIFALRDSNGAEITDTNGNIIWLPPNAAGFPEDQWKLPLIDGQDRTIQDTRGRDIYQPPIGDLSPARDGYRSGDWLLGANGKRQFAAVSDQQPAQQYNNKNLTASEARQKGLRYKFPVSKMRPE